MNSSMPWPDAAGKSFIALADPSVRVGGLVPKFKDFLLRLGRMHYDMFDLPLIITSGNDGAHAAHSPHYENRAVDIRTHDLSDGQAAIFGACLIYFAPVVKIATFDERNVPGGPHFHVEYHGD